MVWWGENGRDNVSVWSASNKQTPAVDEPTKKKKIRRSIYAMDRNGEDNNRANRKITVTFAASSVRRWYACDDESACVGKCLSERKFQIGMQVI